MINNIEETKSIIKDLIIEASTKKEVLANELIKEINNLETLKILYNALTNFVLLNNEKELTYYLTKKMYLNPKTDLYIIEILIKLHKNPKLILSIYLSGLDIIEKEANNGIINAKKYIEQIEKSKIKELTNLSKKYRKINKLLSKYNSTYEEADTCASSILYKLSIEFKDEHNYINRHTILMINYDDTFLGSFYNYLTIGKINKNNELELKIIINNDIVTLIINLNNNTVKEIVNEINTKKQANGYLIKVFNDEEMLAQVRANNKIAENTKVSMLIKTL